MLNKNIKKPKRYKKWIKPLLKIKYHKSIYQSKCSETKRFRKGTFKRHKSVARTLALSKRQETISVSAASAVQKWFATASPFIVVVGRKAKNNLIHKKKNNYNANIKQY